MDSGRSARKLLSPSLWQRFWSRVLALLRGAGRLQLPAGVSAEPLPEDLQELYRRVERKPGLVIDTVHRAIEDYQHLRAAILGPGATADAVDDVTLLADAEDLLRDLLRRAPLLQSVVTLAGGRKRDRAAREATGEAMLAFGDRGRALHELTSAALRWASSGSSEDLARLQRGAARLKLDGP